MEISKFVILVCSKSNYAVSSLALSEKSAVLQMDFRERKTGIPALESTQLQFKNEGENRKVVGGPISQMDVNLDFFFFF